MSRLAIASLSLEQRQGYKSAEYRAASRNQVGAAARPPPWLESELVEQPYDKEKKLQSITLKCNLKVRCVEVCSHLFELKAVIFSVKMVQPQMALRKKC